MRMAPHCSPLPRCGRPARSQPPGDEAAPEQSDRGGAHPGLAVTPLSIEKAASNQRAHGAILLCEEYYEQCCSCGAANNCWIADQLLDAIHRRLKVSQLPEIAW